MLAILQQFPIVPVFNHSHLPTCCNVANACEKAGVRLFEFTNRGPEALEVFTQFSNYCVQNLPALQVGAGTITTATQAQQFIDNGATFIVSPFGSYQVAQVCQKANVPYIPGCMTLKEIAEALEWGCEIVKLFPGEVLTTAFVKALKGPMPHVHAMVTGGVTVQNIATWFAAGCTAVGIGSQLFSENVLATQNYESITQQLLLAHQSIR